MALQDGYGVLIGRLTGFHRDLPDAQGCWSHTNLEIAAAGQTHWASVGMLSRKFRSAVRWKVLSSTQAELGPLPFGSEGFNWLRSAPLSGCLDHVHHPVTQNPRITRPKLLGLIPLPTVTTPQPWSSGTQDDAASALESILKVGSTTLVWGEPFDRLGQGVRNIHQNQGDPIESPWWDDNGVWQDGGVAVVADDGRLQLFISKFEHQVDRTDPWGHPA